MRKFKEFKDQGWIKERTPDKAKAKSLVESSKHRFDYFKSLIVNDISSNYIIENMYDVIRELVEAKMILDGYKTYSHEAMVSYLKVIGFTDLEVKFTDELRETRHRTKYSGFITDVEYAKKVIAFTNNIYKKLRNLTE